MKTLVVHCLSLDTSITLEGVVEEGVFRRDKTLPGIPLDCLQKVGKGYQYTAPSHFDLPNICTEADFARMWRQSQGRPPLHYVKDVYG